jgi:hemolysin-activating ACP:hemolysin acyltransferase
MQLSRLMRPSIRRKALDLQAPAARRQTTAEEGDLRMTTKAVDGVSFRTNTEDHVRPSARPMAAIKFEARLGQIALVLMRTRQHRYSFLGDLEWLVLPAIATNQFMVAEHRDSAIGISIPAAVVLWAQVSNEVDARLSGGQAYLVHKNIQHTVRYTELAPDRFKHFWMD